jgi:hypothetical protein
MEIGIAMKSGGGERVMTRAPRPSGLQAARGGASGWRTVGRAFSRRNGRIAVSRHDHDARYHRLFSDPAIVPQLLREFVDGPWTPDLDLDGMVPQPTQFHADTGERREGDKIWRIPRRDGTDAYLVLVLEFQSTSDRFMALRVATYTCLLLQQLISERRLMPNGELPPVLAVVLHNGDGRWRAPLALRDLVGLPQGSPLWHWQPDMRYHLIDVGAFGKADLEARTGLPALWFRLENARDAGELALAANAVFAAARALFIEFLSAALAPLEPEFQIPGDWLEVRNMLLTRTEQWKQEWLQEGRQEGRQAGEAALLLRQLEQRFGALPDWASRRVTEADTETLEAWGVQMLDAASLTDVVGARPE